MEQSEELVRAQTGDDNQVQLCIEDLEKEAFERGLPEKDNVLFGSGNHEVLNNSSHRQRISGQGELVGKSPVILLIDDEEASLTKCRI